MTRFYDNTRLSSARACMRKHYYRHVRHWEPDSREAALAFGSAWHSAMEVVWPMMLSGKSDKEILTTAFIAWDQTWTENGFPGPKNMDYETEKELTPRTPGVAFEMLADYIEARRDKVKGAELIAVEKPLIVPLDPDDDSLFYVGKLDKVIRKDGQIRSVEHKTTTLYRKEGGFRSNFLDSFSPNSQVDGYLYALHMLWPGEVGGVWIDAALVHRSETAFKFIPVEKALNQLDLWLWETRYWIDQVEAHKAALEEVKPTDPFMAAFPRRTENCQDFARNCPYIDVCRATANPTRIDQPPPGFHEAVWDPLNEIPGLRMEVEKIK